MKNKKNILIIAAVFPPEPVVSASILYDLASSLSTNYNVTILRPVPSRPMGFKFTEPENKNHLFNLITIKSYVNPKSNLLGRFYESYSMGKVCKQYIKENSQNINFIYNAPWQLIGRYQIAKIAKKLKIPYMIPVQDIYPESITSKLPNIKLIKLLVFKLLVPFDKYALKNASKIHTISPKMIEYLSKTRNIKTDNFISIYNWQNEKDFIALDNSIKNNFNKKRYFTYMYMGNIGPLAGLEKVIYAFYRANLNHCRLVIAGSGSSKTKLEGIIERERIKNIEFWDVPKGKVPIIQSKADVMLLPVRKGFSLTSIPSKLPAYMFSAKPIIACVDKKSEISLAISQSNSGWVIEPENEVLLSKAFNDIAKLNPFHLKFLGNNGLKYSLDNFSRGKNLQKLVNSCMDIINNT